MLFKKYKINVDYNVVDEEKIEKAVWLLGGDFVGIEHSKLFPECKDRRKATLQTKDKSFMKRLDILLKELKCEYGYDLSW